MAQEPFGLRRIVTYGYNAKSEFEIEIEERVEDDAGKMTEGPFYEGPVKLTRAECQTILKHMQFGKTGDDKRVFESLDGKKV